MIRGEEDKGIVCILDSRILKYMNRIKEVLPIKNFTDNIEIVKQFVKENQIDS